MDCISDYRGEKSYEGNALPDCRRSVTRLRSSTLNNCQFLTKCERTGRRRPPRPAPFVPRGRSHVLSRGFTPARHAPPGGHLAVAASWGTRRRRHQASQPEVRHQVMSLPDRHQPSVVTPPAPWALVFSTAGDFRRVPVTRIVLVNVAVVWRARQAPARCLSHLWRLLLTRGRTTPGYFSTWVHVVWVAH